MTPLALHNQHVQRLRRLIGRRESRLGEGLVVVEGAKVLAEALDAGVIVDAVFVTAAGAGEPVLLRVASDVAVHVVADDVFGRVCDTKTPQPICAIVRWAPDALATLEPALRKGGFVLVAVDLRDPGNAGTLLRSVEAAGAVGVVLAGTSVDVTSPKVVRSSAGSLFHVPVVTGVSVQEVVSAFVEWEVRVWAAVVRSDASVDHDRADLLGPTAVVVGNEARGLSADELHLIQRHLTIPMVGRTESLNVSMSASILAFEAARQRRLGSPS